MGTKKPLAVAFLIQATFAGMVLLSKAAFNTGFNTAIFVFYRQLAGTLFLTPFAIIFEWKKWTPLSMPTMCKIFILAFLGITVAMNVYGIALVYTSASLAAASVNCLPVTTFAFALLLRMEKVKMRTVPGVAKVAGIAVCIGGVAVLAFYKGPHLKPVVHHGLEFGHSSNHNDDDDDEGQGHFSSGKQILGCFLLLISSMCCGLWLVLQGQVLKIYPSKLAFTWLQSLSSTIQSFVIAIAIKRDAQDWKLGWNVTLISVLYCGMVVTGGTYYMQAWVVAKKGPVFLAITTPLTLIFTILGCIFLLGEAVHLGSVLGGILLVISLYSMLWGKCKEEGEDDMKNQNCLPVQDEPKSSELIVKPISSSGLL
ncbi:hypothetical protein PTKIN_Ptkin01aG0281600 [Pterospermum kingtungense]